MNRAIVEVWKVNERKIGEFGSPSMVFLLNLACELVADVSVSSR